MKSVPWLLFLAAKSVTLTCFLLQERRKEEEKRKKQEEVAKKRREEDLKRRREEEVQRRREVVARTWKQSKVTSTTTSEEEESNGERAVPSRSKKFLNLFSNSSTQYSATGMFIVQGFYLNEKSFRSIYS